MLKIVMFSPSIWKMYGPITETWSQSITQAQDLLIPTWQEKEKEILLAWLTMGSKVACAFINNLLMTIRNRKPLMFFSASTLRQSIWNKFKTDWNSCSWEIMKDRYLILIHGDMEIMGIIIICWEFCNNFCLHSDRTQKSMCMIRGPELLSSPIDRHELSLKTVFDHCSFCLKVHIFLPHWSSHLLDNLKGLGFAWFYWIFQFWGELYWVENHHI